MSSRTPRHVSAPTLARLRRSAGRGFDGARLTESQAELVRLVGRQPGISVSAAAAELGLVANTTSTLVSKLVTDGMLTREADPTDRRIGRLVSLRRRMEHA